MFEIGNSLREARLRQGLDFPEVEHATKIRGKYLRALEDEQFDILPGQTYVKGFLRTYSEYLGLDGQLYVDEYNSRYIPGDDDPGLLLGTARCDGDEGAGEKAPESRAAARQAQHHRRARGLVDGGPRRLGARTGALQGNARGRLDCPVPAAPAALHRARTARQPALPAQWSRRPGAESRQPDVGARHAQARDARLDVRLTPLT